MKVIVIIISVIIFISLFIYLPFSVSAESYPVLELASGVGTNNISPINVPYPTGYGGISPGDLLLFVACSNIGGSFDESSILDAGFTNWFTQWGYANAALAVYYKLSANGSETPINIVFDTAWGFAFQIFRISGHRQGVGVNSVLAYSSVWGADGNPNPGSLNPGGWGTEKTLWLALSCKQSNNGIPYHTGNPTNYTAIRNDTGIDQYGRQMATAYRQHLVGIEDPSPFTWSGDLTNWGAATIGIRPTNIEPIVTLGATQINYNSAILNGRLDLLFSAQVELSFEYGYTVALGNDSGSIIKTSTGTYFVKISNLQPNTTVYYRAHSIEIPSGYESFGTILNFTTSIYPSVYADVWNGVILLSYTSLVVLFFMAAFWIRKRRGGFSI